MENLLALDQRPRKEGRPRREDSRKEGQINGEVVAKLHLVEKHIRKNRLQVFASVGSTYSLLLFMLGLAWCRRRLRCCSCLRVLPAQAAWCQLSDSLVRG